MTIQQCVEERVSDAMTKQYVWGLYVDELLEIKLAGGTKYYPLQDLLYRTNVLTDSSGAVYEKFDYDAYGNTLIFDASDNAKSNPVCEFLFTGRRYDTESQLYFYRARYYNPELGRFISKDPNGYVDGMSLNEYVKSNPVIYVDPSGSACCDQCKWGKTKNERVTRISYGMGNGVIRPDVDDPGPAKAFIAIVNIVGAAQTALATGTAATAKDAAGALTDGAIGQQMGIDTNKMIDVLPDIRDDTKKNVGVSIWIYVTYESCKWDRCWRKPWTGANDWKKTKAKPHRCSAEGPNAPYKGAIPGGAGFAYNNKAGIAAAIPGCVCEAINKIKNR